MAKSDSARKSKPPFQLPEIRRSIDETREYVKAATGSATQVIKTVQDYLKQTVGQAITGYIDFGSDHDGDYCCILEWNGNRIQVVSEFAGDEPASHSHKAALELPAHRRIEVALKLRDLVAALKDEAKKQADELGVLADEARKDSSSNQEDES